MSAEQRSTEELERMVQAAMHSRLGRAAWKKKAAAQRRQLRALARMVARSEKDLVRRRAAEHLGRLLAMSVQHCEDVLTGRVREDFEISDESHLKLRHAVAEQVFDRAGLPKRNESSLTLVSGEAPILFKLEGGLGWPLPEAGKDAAGAGGEHARRGPARG